MHIVLVEPQIPQNTGNIARLCAATATQLHLVGKLGFRTDDRHLRRAGLDYWRLLDIYYYEDFDEFEMKCAEEGNLYILTTKGDLIYSEAAFSRDDYLIFGSETGGISEEISRRYSANCLRIPMTGEARSLNLATSAGIVLYEALRQTSFFTCPPFP